MADEHLKSVVLAPRILIFAYPGPHSRRFVGEFSSIVRILLRVMNRLWNQFSMSHVVTSQFVLNDFTWLTSVFSQ
jgi:hypothetical protein